MAAKSSQFGLVRLLLRASQASRRGFTLIELLVALIVGSLIMGSLLYLVVELMQVNRREEVLGQTQQDMRRAIDYINRDVREAVFVYSTPNAIVEPKVGTVEGTETLLDQLDGIPVGANPVLAFWRLDPVPDDSEFWKKDCTKAGAQINECNTLKLRQSYYTLVLYLQQDNAANDFWGGPSRIIRYELPKYSLSDIETLIQRKGYSDPTGCSSFANWSRPPGRDSTNPCDSANTGKTAPTVAVLTDYVNTDGFTATVSGGDNKTVNIALQGNATAGRPGIINTFNNAGALPTLESEILVRGVLNKQPAGVTP